MNIIFYICNTPNLIITDFFVGTAYNGLPAD